MTPEELDRAVREIIGKPWWERLLDRFPPWPSERQWVTIALFAMAGLMFKMAVNDPKLWEIKLFEILIQAVVLTGCLNMILAFHFSANGGERDSAIKRAETTAKAFDAITATAQASASAPETPIPVVVQNDADTPVPVDTAP